jgi:hypothetical protein
MHQPSTEWKQSLQYHGHLFPWGRCLKQKWKESRSQHPEGYTYEDGQAPHYHGNTIGLQPTVTPQEVYSKRDAKRSEKMLRQHETGESQREKQTLVGICEVETEYYRKVS